MYYCGKTLHSTNLCTVCHANCACKLVGASWESFYYFTILALRSTLQSFCNWPRHHPFSCWCVVHQQLQSSALMSTNSHIALNLQLNRKHCEGNSNRWDAQLCMVSEASSQPFQSTMHAWLDTPACGRSFWTLHTSTVAWARYSKLHIFDTCQEFIFLAYHHSDFTAVCCLLGTAVHLALVLTSLLCKVEMETSSPRRVSRLVSPATKEQILLRSMADLLILCFKHEVLFASIVSDIKPKWRENREVNLNELWWIFLSALWCLRALLPLEQRMHQQQHL